MASLTRVNRSAKMLSMGALKSFYRNTTISTNIRSGLIRDSDASSSYIDCNEVISVSDPTVQMLLALVRYVKNDQEKILCT